MNNHEREDLQGGNSGRRRAIAAIGTAGASLLAGASMGSAGSPPHAAAFNSEIVSIDLAGLRTSTKPNSQTIYALTDAGREGWFRYIPEDKTSKDNDGTLIVSKAGKRFHRLYEGPLNVQWFGAKGDGQCDDAPALTKALQWAVNSGQVAYIPRTGSFYSIRSTVYARLVAGQQMVLESNGATIKAAANIQTPRSSSLWRMGGFIERIFLSIGVAVDREKEDKYHLIPTAFENNGGTSVEIRGLIIDGATMPPLLTTLKDGKRDESVTFGVALQISAENVTVEGCRFQHVFGYGARIHGPRRLTFRDSVFHEVGGRGNTPHLKLDMDAFGDGLHLSSIVEDAQITVENCTFLGLTSLPFRSRVGLTFEYGQKAYNALVRDCSFTHYAKCIHVEEKAPSNLKIQSCLFQDMNCGIANVLNDKGHCHLSDCKIVLTDIDDHDPPSTLLCLNYQSDCFLTFSNCQIDFNTTGGTWQAMAGPKLFQGCAFYGHGKNHFFADADARFSNCWFHDMGGTYKTFFSYNGGNEYVLENCDFTGDDIYAQGQNLKLSFINCRHHTPGKRLLGTYFENLGGIFPNANGECTEHILKGTTADINPETCPSPLWQSVNRILAIVCDPAKPFGREQKNYRKFVLELDATGNWTAGTPGMKEEEKKFRVVLAPAHYQQYLG